MLTLFLVNTISLFSSWRTFTVSTILSTRLFPSTLLPILSGETKLIWAVAYLGFPWVGYFVFAYFEKELKLWLSFGRAEACWFSILERLFSLILRLFCPEWTACFLAPRASLLCAAWEGEVEGISFPKFTEIKLVAWGVLIVVFSVLFLLWKEF